MVADSAPFGGSITFIYTSSWDASRRFYQDDLALTVLFDKGDVLFFALPGGRGSTLGLVRQGISAANPPPCDAQTAGRDSVMLCLLTSDVSGWHEKLVKLGHPSVQAPQDNPGFGICNALLRDPGGYLIELQQFLDASEHSHMVRTISKLDLHPPANDVAPTCKRLVRDLCALCCLLLSLVAIVALGKNVRRRPPARPDARAIRDRQRAPGRSSPSRRLPTIWSTDGRAVR